jgi:NAD(P)-dependent dehydrogenase (short-subunit alcohol dehydrogenase family)
MAATTKTQRRLAGRVAIVTGAGRGIGRAEAMLMALEGAKLVINDLGSGTDGGGADENVAQRVADEIRAAGGTAVANHDSVATMQGGANIVKAAIDSFGRLDILINNAGNVRRHGDARPIVHRAPRVDARRIGLADRPRLHPGAAVTAFKNIVDRG